MTRAPRPVARHVRAANGEVQPVGELEEASDAEYAPAHNTGRRAVMRTQTDLNRTSARVRHYRLVSGSCLQFQHLSGGRAGVKLVLALDQANVVLSVQRSDRPGCLTALPAASKDLAKCDKWMRPVLTEEDATHL